MARFNSILFHHIHVVRVV